jgi:hypothetical protein
MSRAIFEVTGGCGLISLLLDRNGARRLLVEAAVFPLEVLFNEKPNRGRQKQ